MSRRSIECWLRGMGGAMNILLELLALSEAKGKNLLGLTINNKKITEQTPHEPWPGNFSCSYNQLTSLEFCPKEVSGNFYCSDNKLTSLEFCPKEVGGSFGCFNNQLTSLEFCPEKVGGYFSCSYNKITSLADIHKRLKKMNGTFFADDNPIKSNVIGLMLVAGCKEVVLDNKEVEKIMNKHLKSPFGHLRLLECQEDLLSAGFEEWAEL